MKHEQLIRLMLIAKNYDPNIFRAGIPIGEKSDDLAALTAAEMITPDSENIHTTTDGAEKLLDYLLRCASPPVSIVDMVHGVIHDLRRRIEAGEGGALDQLQDFIEVAPADGMAEALKRRKECDEPGLDNTPQKQPPGLFVDGNATIVLDYVVGVTTGGYSASEFRPASSDTDVHMLSGSANITESATPAFLEALRMHHGTASSPTVDSGVRVVLRDDRSNTGDPAVYQNADRGDTPGLVKAAHAERDRHRDRADHAMRILSTLLGQAAVAKIKLNTPIGYNGADDEDPVEN